MLKFTVYVPKIAKNQVLDAIFEAGAGRLGRYDSFYFETAGTSQFRPLDGANPAIGSVGRVERVEEVKIETLCESKDRAAIVNAMKAAHPYETPAYEVMHLEEP